MNIFLQRSSVTGENPWAQSEFDRVVLLSRASRNASHQLVLNPEDADIIFFVGAATFEMSDIWRHPLYQQFPDRCVLISASDRFVPFVRGLYPSISQRWHDPGYSRSICYLRVSADQRFTVEPPPVEQTLLFSFRGNAASHRVRQRVMKLRHRLGTLTDTGASSYKPENGEVYRQELLRSQFVLCPRGGGPSTFRLFETLAAGRCPVIISDEWVPPEGPLWDEFTVRVRERDIESIPQRLEELSYHAAVMGQKARIVWNAHFSVENAFSYLVQQASSMLETPVSQTRRSLRLIQQLANPFCLRRVLGGVLSRYWNLGRGD